MLEGHWGSHLAQAFLRQGLLAAYRTCLDTVTAALRRTPEDPVQLHVSDWRAFGEDEVPCFVLVCVAAGLLTTTTTTQLSVAILAQDKFPI